MSETNKGVIRDAGCSLWGSPKVIPLSPPSPAIAFFDLRSFSEGGSDGGLRFLIQYNLLNFAILRWGGLRPSTDEVGGRGASYQRIIIRFLIR